MFSMKKTAFILFIVLILSLIVSCSVSGTLESKNSLSNDNNVAISEISKETSTQDVVSIDDSNSDESKPETSSVDTSTLINTNLDIILKDVTYTDEEKLATYNSDEFSAIVDLEEEAFPVLDEIINNKNNSIEKRAFALHTKYTIKPELYDLSFPSPDGKYSIECSVYTFDQALIMFGHTKSGFTYRDIRLVDEANDSVIAVSDFKEMSVNVKWSSDSKYAALSSGHVSYYKSTDVFDVQNAKFIELPSLNVVEEKSKFNEELNYFGAF